MGIFDWLFEPTKNLKESSEIPEWMSQAGKTNYQLASQIAQKPYQAYSMPRIAPMSGDQNTAMGLLRTNQPRALQNGGEPYRPPRLIDNIPGETPGGIKDYENPYTENVINRGMTKMREAADMGQQRINNQAHMSESFGDARHGIDSSLLEGEFQKEVGDFAGQQYAQGYEVAQGLREADINRLMQSQELERADFSDLMTYIDSLYRSGGNQQDLSQRSADLAYEDYLRQQGYPAEMLNLLTAALTGTPHDTKSFQAGPSNASSILSTAASVLGAFI